MEITAIWLAMVVFQYVNALARNNQPLGAEGPAGGWRLPAYNEVTSCAETLTITSTTTSVPTTTTQTTTQTATTLTIASETQTIISDVTSTVLSVKTVTVTATMGTTTIIGDARRGVTQRTTQVIPLLPALGISTRTSTSTEPTSTVINTETSTATVVISSTVTSITQDRVVATVTITQTSTTTVDVEITVTAQPSPPRLGNLEFTRSSFSLWGISVAGGAADGQAGLVSGGIVQEQGDVFKLTESGQRFTVVSSTNAPSLVGATLYYDPGGARYGPSGGSGLCSYLVPAPADDATTALTNPVNCSINAQSHVECVWDAASGIADWWYCRGNLLLVHPGTDATSFCTSDSVDPFHLPYVAFVDPLT